MIPRCRPRIVRCQRAPVGARPCLGELAERRDNVATSPMEERSMLTEAGDEVVIGPLDSSEHQALFAIFDDVVARGDGYPQAPPLTGAVFESTWVTSVT